LVALPETGDTAHQRLEAMNAVLTLDLFFRTPHAYS